MDLLDEQLLSLNEPAQCESLLPVAEAFERLTGRRPAPATWHRWRLKGLNRVRLPTVLYLGQRMCSLRAAQEFLEASTRAADGENGFMPAGQSPSARAVEARRDAAERDCIEAGA